LSITGNQTQYIPKSGGKQELPPGFFRRIAAICYDAILLIAVLFIATALLLPINSGQAFTTEQYYYPIYLFIISFFFFGWFWTHGGQTLGQRAWKIKVLTFTGKQLNWQQAFIRFLWAIFSWALCGLGFLWILVSKDKLAWHDHLSKTKIVYVSKQN
jgi:uncharacterized RDD family membrane protein YckC